LPGHPAVPPGGTRAVADHQQQGVPGRIGDRGRRQGRGTGQERTVGEPRRLPGAGLQAQDAYGAEGARAFQEPLHLGDQPLPQQHRRAVVDEQDDVEPADPGRPQDRVRQPGLGHRLGGRGLVQLPAVRVAHP
jgi:hypothetical protein